MNPPLVIGNWKNNTTLPEARALAQKLVPQLQSLEGAEIVLCPPAPWIGEVFKIVEGSPVKLGAQNVYYAEGGSFTGEVTPRMLKGVCEYVLIGQYERRIFFDEKEGIVRRKLESVQRQGMSAVLCVGETADDLDDGAGPYVVTHQLETALEDGTLDSRLVIAYEPVWTTMGRVNPPPLTYIADMCGHVRATLADLFSTADAEPIRVIFGGSVNPRNAAEIAALPGLNGVMTGASSTNADAFVSIARSFAEDS
jgi:triosephosphate isomerase